MFHNFRAFEFTFDSNTVGIIAFTIEKYLFKCSSNKKSEIYYETVLGKTNLDFPEVK